MNYRHVYHAGNFADVVKHVMLIACMDHLRKKEKPFCVLDAHGGCGFYGLDSEQALKTNEWKSGIGALGELSNKSVRANALRQYFDLVMAQTSESSYPGSPTIAAKCMREQDRLVCNELHPEDYLTLKSHLRSLGNGIATNLDAYEFVRAQTPPSERRGLVIIDPPFEKPDEIETIVRQMGEWKRRWPTGVYLIWYPIKAKLETSLLCKAAVDEQWSNAWNFSFHRPDHDDGMNSCGILLLNAPYQIADVMQDCMELIKDPLNIIGYQSECLTS